MENLTFRSAGHKEMSSILADHTSALVYEPERWGGGVSGNEYGCAQGAQINFGDLSLKGTVS